TPGEPRRRRRLRGHAARPLRIGTPRRQDRPVLRARAGAARTAVRAVAVLAFADLPVSPAFGTLPAAVFVFAGCAVSDFAVSDFALTGAFGALASCPDNLASCSSNARLTID